MTNSLRTHAFTLIELLIVVAIIAILAAIAVPNFLEAQVRSKVSRVHSDLRTLATAIESYAVDYNRGPCGYVEWDLIFGLSGNNQRWRFGCYSQLTTPVAYVTSFLQDPFASFVKSEIPGRENRDEMKYYAYNTMYAAPYVFGGETGEPAAGCRRNGFFWSLYSIGPMQMDNPNSQFWIEYMLSDPVGTGAIGNIYDSTNGTKSWGRIHRTNKGILTGDQLK